MPIEDFVVSNITVQTEAVEQAGFGVMLLLGGHDVYDDPYRFYQTNGGSSAMIADGFEEGHPLVQMASALARQNPSPPIFIVGKASATATQGAWIIALDSGASGPGDTITVVVRGPNLSTSCAYEIAAEEDTTDAATAIAALIGAIAGLDATATGSTINVEATEPGAVFYFGISRAQGTVIDDSEFGRYTSALGELENLDVPFYGVAIDSYSAADIEDVATWTEARNKVFFPGYIGPISGSDSMVALMGDLDTMHNTFPLYVEPDAAHLYPAITWGAYALAKDPGRVTLAFKELPGVSPSTLTPSQVQTLKTAKANYYYRVGGRNITAHGWAGTGRFADITLTKHYLEARLAERVFGWIASQDKVPLTDASGDIIRGKILAVLKEGQQGEGPILNPEVDVTVTVPKVATINPTDRANRLFPGITWSAQAGNAVHGATINGTVII